MSELISLGHIRPAGITQGEGSTLYVTNVLFGGVRKVDVTNGTVTEVVPNGAHLDRTAVAIAYHNGALFVAGGTGSATLGSVGAVYVYDAATGRELVSCSPGSVAASFLNGIAIVGAVAYATDPQRNRLLLPIRASSKAVTISNKAVTQRLNDTGNAALEF